MTKCDLCRKQQQVTAEMCSRFMEYLKALSMELIAVRQENADLQAELESAKYEIARNCETLFKNYWMNATEENRKVILQYTRSFSISPILPERVKKVAEGGK